MASAEQIRLTKPQLRELTRAFRNSEVMPRGSQWVVYDALGRKGLTEPCGMGRRRITRGGLEALLYHRKMEDWRHGSIASMQNVAEVEEALAHLAANFAERSA